MSTPQDPARRAKLKRMRTKKLAEWRAKQAAAAEKAPAAHVSSGADKAPAAKKK